MDGFFGLHFIVNLVNAVMHSCVGLGRWHMHGQLSVMNIKSLWSKCYAYQRLFMFYQKLLCAFSMSCIHNYIFERQNQLWTYFHTNLSYSCFSVLPVWRFIPIISGKYVNRKKNKINLNNARHFDIPVINIFASGKHSIVHSLSLKCMHSVKFKHAIVIDLVHVKRHDALVIALHWMIMIMWQSDD